MQEKLPVSISLRYDVKIWRTKFPKRGRMSGPNLEFNFYHLIIGLSIAFDDDYLNNKILTQVD